MDYVIKDVNGNLSLPHEIIKFFNIQSGDGFRTLCYRENMEDTIQITKISKSILAANAVDIGIDNKEYENEQCKELKKELFEKDRHIHKLKSIISTLISE